TAARVVLTQQRLLESLPEGAAERVCLDADWPAIARESGENPPGQATADNLAYVIYTSGSTGAPKGVMIRHQGLVNYLTWCTKAYAVSEGRGSPVHSSIGFDLTVTSLFPPLLTGRRVEMLPEGAGIESLAKALRREGGYSLVKITPAHLELLSHVLPESEAAGRARAFIIGGDALREESLAFWRTHARETRLINEYGPTETVVGCCVYEAPQGPYRESRSGTVPIGRPIANTQLYVLDRFLQPAPIGVAGELYIGGDGVARGYWKRPDLTAERFVSNPFHSGPGARLYKTGDLARYLPDGNLEYLGRIDDQVKIRGYRIEPGEVESALAQHPSVAESVVVAREDVPGDKRLTAYVVARGERPPSVSELRTFLKETLPDYMVPPVLVFLDALPLTPNGKVDWRALPQPGLERAEAGHGGSLPRDTLQLALLKIWEEVLGVRSVGVRDNFFELGGHSLLAVRLFADIEKAFGRNLPLATLFEAPTVERLAAKLRDEGWEAPWSSLVVIQGG
ncbi:MAG: non-ribosomal peptide synthetase, partial [Thermoanaerobaculia bacterium]